VLRGESDQVTEGHHQVGTVMEGPGTIYFSFREKIRFCVEITQMGACMLTESVQTWICFISRPDSNVYNSWQLGYLPLYCHGYTPLCLWRILSQMRWQQ